MYRPRRKNERGFTTIEMVIVLIAIGIALAVVVVASSGVQAKNRNSQRRQDIDSLQTQLETYYAGSPDGQYPATSQMNDADWRAKNLPKLMLSTMRDPRWNVFNKHCVADKQTTFSAEPATGCYSYQATDTSGADCDNQGSPCAHFTLTATLEGGLETYVKSSLN